MNDFTSYCIYYYKSFGKLLNKQFLMIIVANT